jgi:hypothetical protein
LEADHAERIEAVAGDCFTFQGMSVLALDEPTHQLVSALTAFCGGDSPDDVDSALVAILWKRPIILHGKRSDDVIELARTIHEHSIRKGFPFTQVERVPKSNPAVEALCTKAGCGTIFLDLTKPIVLPSRFVRHLFSDHFHLWTIAVARVAKDARRCFGPGAEYFPLCELGFRRAARRRATQRPHSQIIPLRTN